MEPPDFTVHYTIQNTPEGVFLADSSHPFGGKRQAGMAGDTPPEALENLLKIDPTQVGLYSYEAAVELIVAHWGKKGKLDILRDAIRRAKPPATVGGQDRLRDLDAIVNHLLQTAQVDVMPADTLTRMEELSAEGVLSIINYPGSWDEEKEDHKSEALEYARGLLRDLDKHMANARVG